MKTATNNNLEWMAHWMGLEPDALNKVEFAKSPTEIPGYRKLLNINVPSERLGPLGALKENVLIRDRGAYQVTAEVYLPEGDGPFPLFLYIHGGGWCLSEAAHARKAASDIAAYSRYAVVSINYGLSPEFPFPMALEDCVYAARWMLKNKDYLRSNDDFVAIGGESAGANLAAATIVALTSEDGLEGLDEGDEKDVRVSFSAAALFYGVYDFPLLFSEAPGYNAGAIEVHFCQAYLGSHFLKHFWDPRVSPMFSNVGGFPPTYVNCGDRDPFLAQSLNLTKRLSQGGIETTLSVVGGVDHGFMHLGHVYPAAAKEITNFHYWLKTRAAMRGFTDGPTLPLRE